MGHERIGALPRTKPWRAVVGDLARLQVEETAGIARIARRTLENVRQRYDRIHTDSGVTAAFTYLLWLSNRALRPTDIDRLIGINLGQNPSPVRLASKLNEWVSQNADFPEYAEIARRAGGETIAIWTRERGRQRQLFGGEPDASRVWEMAADAGGFCELARLFFAKFTERYLRYFLEREASAELPSLIARERFSQRLWDHVDSVSRHAFETSRITQSFAAGWFNKYARTAQPTDSQIRSFLALAFGKLQEELRRESAM